MTRLATPAILILATLLEIGGDAVIRQGLIVRGPRSALLLAGGGACLVAYGVVLNLAPIEWDRLIGLYVVVFFLAGQTINLFLLHTPPSWPMLAGGSLIVAGGLVIAACRP